MASIRSVSTISTSPHDQTFALPDGRLLGFAEYGYPSGTPLLFFHGFPTSRLEASGGDDAARRRKLRLISIDRPGYGLSTFKPDRRILDWPADVKALAEHLGLSRFAVLGGSGGGPYAVACAHSLPKDMLLAVGLLASAGPWVPDTMKHVPWLSYLTYLAATYTPSGLRLATDGAIGSLRWLVTTGPATRWLDQWLDRVEGEGGNEEGVTKAQRREKVLKVAFDGFAQGADGFVQEAQLLSQPWGFRFEDVRYDKIKIWHGTKDTNAPISMIRYMAECLPYCVLNEYDESHFTMAQRLDDILEELVSEIGGSESRRGLQESCDEKAIATKLL